MNDVVYVTDCGFGKGMHDMPRSALIRRTVDVNFVALKIIKVFAPENAAIGRGGDM